LLRSTSGIPLIYFADVNQVLVKVAGQWQEITSCYNMEILPKLGNWVSMSSLIKQTPFPLFLHDSLISSLQQLRGHSGTIVL
jgi:hypothetical protein